jgi:hypothetical protein
MVLDVAADLGAPVVYEVASVDEMLGDDDDIRWQIGPRRTGRRTAARAL